jgi:ADP-ribose pyrophosphatase
MKLISSRERYRCSLFRVTEDHATDPGGFEIKRSIVRHAGSAVMMPVDAQGRILLVRQYRLPAKAKLWELPAGKVDAGEKPLGAAKRELIEETGYRAKRWKKLVSFYPSPGYISEKMTIFLATELTAGAPQPMDDERIECRWFAAKQVERMIRTNKIEDGKTMIGYFVWRNWRLK